jgi:hypothetical protein
MFRIASLIKKKGTMLFDKMTSSALLPMYNTLLRLEMWHCLSDRKGKETDVVEAGRVEVFLSSGTIIFIFTYLSHSKCV